MRVKADGEKTMAYLWSGRMKSKLHQAVKDFTFSLPVDRILALYDIQGSIVHACMLGKCRIIAPVEASRLVKGLKAIAKEFESGKFKFAAEDEDIHTAVERRLIELVGKVGEKLHTGRSRNDQIVLDEKLYLKDALAGLAGNLKSLQKVLLKCAERVYPAVMPAYTHLQPSQPVLTAHHLLAYLEMFGRDSERLKDAWNRMDVLPLGVAAGSGTSLPIDRKFLARELGFSRISANSLDTVSDRDFILETVSVSGIIMVHCSRLAEDLILWNTEEFKFVELPEEFCTGSSIMPQKKNPDVLELVRAKTSVVLANLNGLFLLMKGLPLSYNRDLQEDKHFLFESLETVSACLRVLTELLPNLRFNITRMKEAAGRGLILAGDLAEYLVAKGVPFRKAHQACGQLVRYCLAGHKDFAELSLQEFRKFAPEFGRDVYRKLTPEKSVGSKKSSGGTAPRCVKKELEKWKKILT